MHKLNDNINNDNSSLNAPIGSGIEGVRAGEVEAMPSRLRPLNDLPEDQVLSLSSTILNYLLDPVNVPVQDQLALISDSIS